MEVEKYSESINKFSRGIYIVLQYYYNWGVNVGQGYHQDTEGTV
jgi:hypothetical protein